MKTCPYCSEEIQDKAIKCRYCGEFIKDEEEIKEFKNEFHEEGEYQENIKMNSNNKNENIEYYYNIDYISDFLKAKGRMGRLDYFINNILIGFLAVAISFILGIFLGILNINEKIISAIVFIIQLIFLFIAIIFIIKRLHDLSKSGWYSLYFFIPLTVINFLNKDKNILNDFNAINGVFIIFIFIFLGILYFKKGTKGNNKYGLELK